MSWLQDASPAQAGAQILPCALTQYKGTKAQDHLLLPQELLLQLLPSDQASVGPALHHRRLLAGRSSSACSSRAPAGRTGVWSACCCGPPARGTGVCRLLLALQHVHHSLQCQCTDHGFLHARPQSSDLPLNQRVNFPDSINGIGTSEPEFVS